MVPYLFLFSLVIVLMKNKPVKILIVLNAFELDGPGLFTQKLLKYVHKNDFDLKVMGISRDGKLRQKFSSESIEAQLIQARSISGLLQFSARLEDLYDGGSPDIIHTNLLWPDLIFRYFKKTFPNAKLISTCHGLHASGEKGLAGRVYDVLEFRTRHRCDCWVAVSDFVRKQMIEHGYEKNKVRTIRNGIDLNHYKPVSKKLREKYRAKLSIPEGAPFLIGAGNLRPVKQQHVMVNAMKRVVKEFPEARLIHFGAGPLLRELRQLVEDLKLEKSVQFRKPNFTKLHRIVASADLFLQTSQYESYSLAVAESLACGTPVVASDTAALPELVRESETGSLFPVGDDETLANEILDLLRDPKKLSQMRSNCRNFAEENCSITNSAEKYELFWNEIRGEK